MQTIGVLTHEVLQNASLLQPLESHVRWVRACFTQTVGELLLRDQVEILTLGKRLLYVCLRFPVTWAGPQDRVHSRSIVWDARASRDASSGEATHVLGSSDHLGKLCDFGIKNLGRVDVLSLLLFGLQSRVGTMISEWLLFDHLNIFGRLIL